MPLFCKVGILLLACLCKPSRSILHSTAVQATFDAGRIAEGPGAIAQHTTDLESTYLLKDGFRTPRVGFGVFRVPPGPIAYDSTRIALEVGYRLVDTAEAYGNEADVGRAIRDSGIPRENVFVTTKVFDNHHGYTPALDAGNRSVENIGLDYVDLLLIHSPLTGELVETYKALLELQKHGLVRSVGVSNFGVTHLQILENAGLPLPVVDQIEMHPLIYSDDSRQAVLSFCAMKGILITAYGSIFSGHEDKLDDRPVVTAAQAHNKTSAQVLLRWGLQKGFQVLPKSVHREHIEENAQVFDFELSSDEMAALDAMHGALHEYWQPLDAPVSAWKK